MWSSPVPSLLHIFLHCVNCRVLFPLGTFLRTGQKAIPDIKVTLLDLSGPYCGVRCFLWYSLQYRAWIETLNSFAHFREAVKLGFLRSKITQHQTSFKVKTILKFVLMVTLLLFFWKTKGLCVYKQSWTPPMFTLDLPIVKMQGADMASRDRCTILNSRMPTAYVSYQSPMVGLNRPK